MNIIKQIEDLVSNDGYKYNVTGILLEDKDSEAIVFLRQDGSAYWAYFPDNDGELKEYQINKNGIKKLFNLQPKVDEVYYALCYRKIHQVQIVECGKEENLYYTISLKNGQQYAVREENLFQTEQELIKYLQS